MTTIEMTEEQMEMLNSFAEVEGMTVEDLLLKCVKTIRFFKKEWDEEVSTEKGIPIEETPVEEEKKPKYEVTFDGVAYQGKSCRQLYINLVTGIGPRRLFVDYSGNATVFKPALGKKDNYDLYQKLEDGKVVLYLYVCLSEAIMWRRIDEFAKSLNVTWEKK